MKPNNKTNYSNTYNEEEDVKAWNKKYKPINGREHKYKPGIIFEVPGSLRNKHN